MKGVKNMILGLSIIALTISIHFVAEHGLFFTDIVLPIGLIFVAYGDIHRNKNQYFTIQI